MYRIKNIFYTPRKTFDQILVSRKSSNQILQCELQSTYSFTQEKPVLYNPYTQDHLLQSYLKRTLPSNYFEEVDSDLRRFGKRIVDEVEDKGRQCELKPPQLTHFDAWGNRVDQIETCEEWNSMKSLSAEEGLIAIGYERQFSEWSRLVQMSKLFLFAPVSGLYSCPLAMADGAAKVIENVHSIYGHNQKSLQNAFSHLTSRDPNTFWTSGQWMTEKEGGSDVANGTATVARLHIDGSYRLNGYKWFTSATDSDMAFTLARIIDEKGNIPPGSKGLSLFFLETRDPCNYDKISGLNGLQVQRLKSKLGTRQLPTAELILDETRAELVGKPSQGVKLISSMLTVTRIHTAMHSASNMRRIMMLARDFATKRKVFGSELSRHKLHIRTLTQMEVETRACCLFTFDISRLLGITEINPLLNPDEDNFAHERDLLRLLTPVCKLFVAKRAITVISEGLESFGGAGYLEDTDLPRLLRDAQVSSIWEGTTNVLSLDVLRAIAKSNGKTLNSFFQSINHRLNAVSENCDIRELRSSITKVHIAAGDLRAFITQSTAMGSDVMFTASRDFSYSLARIYCAVLMLEQAVSPLTSDSDVHAAILWCCGRDLSPAATSLRSGAFSEANYSRNENLVFEGYH